MDKIRPPSTPLLAEKKEETETTTNRSKLQAFDLRTSTTQARVYSQLRVGFPGAQKGCPVQQVGVTSIPKEAGLLGIP